MSDDKRKLLDRYTGRSQHPAPPMASEGLAANGEEYQPSNAVSANRPPEMMLELRLQRGDAVAVSYSLLVSAKFNPSEGVALDFTSYRVKIAGRNLGALFRALIQHRLSYIQEIAARLDDQPDDATVVTSVQITPV